MKSLIVVLLIAGLTFWLARPLVLRFCDAADYTRRRNAWVTLTIVGFLSPNIWLFALVAAPVYLWLARRDSNPIAAYLLLLHVVPPVSVEIRAFGINELFSLDNYRLLSFCLLIPVGLRARHAAAGQRPNGARLTDWLVLLSGLLSCMLFVPPDLPSHVVLQDSATNLVRRLFLYTIDVFALYFAFSRFIDSKKKVLDTMASLGLAAAIMASIALFEHFKGWLQYQDIGTRWNPNDPTFMVAWLIRGDSWLRSQASAGHALSLGAILAIAYGFWLFLRTRMPSFRGRIATGSLFAAGMIAAYARGPAIGAVVIYLAYSALRPRVIARFFKVAFIAATAIGLVSMMPISDRILSSALPGSNDQPDATINYRLQLLDQSLELIKANPWFGDQLALQHLQDLRQGQGIIDIVNAYVGYALFNGLVGLALFIGVIGSAGLRVFRTARGYAADDPEWSLAGLNLLACLIGMALMLAGVSLVYATPKLFYALIGLCAAYARIPPGAAHRSSA